MQGIFNLFMVIWIVYLHKKRISKNFTPFRESIQQTFTKDLPNTRYSVVGVLGYVGGIKCDRSPLERTGQGEVQEKLKSLFIAKIY